MGLFSRGTECSKVVSEDGILCRWFNKGWAAIK
jgi:hypothetical protein